MNTTVIVFRKDIKRIVQLRKPKPKRKKWERYEETHGEVISRALDALEREGNRS